MRDDLKSLRSDRNKRSSLTSWAIGLVAGLIGLTLLAIAFFLFGPAGEDLGLLPGQDDRPTAVPAVRTEAPPAAPVALPTFTPTAPVSGGSRPGRQINQGSAQTAVTMDESFIHPTYQPTTEPCETCHSVRP